MSFSHLFQIEPKSWGLRGDSPMWQHLKLRAHDLPLPETFAEVLIWVSHEIEIVCGYPLAFIETVYVPDLASGGMSSGQLSGEFWRGRGLLQLAQNWQQLGREIEEVYVKYLIDKFDTK